MKKNNFVKNNHSIDRRDDTKHHAWFLNISKFHTFICGLRSKPPFNRVVEFFDLKYENFFIFFLFITATSFFIWQHAANLSWDFMAYTLNAKYMFGAGMYYEWIRPPAVQSLIGIFSIFSWGLSEYLYIIFVSSLYLFACWRFADKYELNKLAFYALCISPFVIFFGTAVGSELLGLSFLILLLTYPEYGGVFLGLAFLTRYQNIIFAPLLLLFFFDWKRLLKNIGLFFVVIAPWLIYCYVLRGNAFASLLDTFAMNIGLSSSIYTSLFFDLLIVGSYLWLFFFFGLYKKIKDFKRIDMVMLLFLIIALIFYWFLPLHFNRYLFNIVFPLAYFSYFSFDKLKNKNFFILLVFILSIIFIIGGFIFVKPINTSESFIAPANYTGDCAIVSNGWVHLNYLGANAIPPPEQGLVNYYVDRGYRLVFFKNFKDPEYVLNKTIMSSFPIIFENDNFYVIGNSSICKNKKEVKYDLSYLERLQDRIYIKYNYTVDISAKNVLFTRNF